MFSRREAGAKALALAVGLAAPAVGQTRSVTVPFDLADGRGTLLVHARIDRRPALLILDTGSSHTIVRPSLLGINPHELSAPRTGAGVIGDAIGQAVTLEIGGGIWRNRRIAVMDLSQPLAAYREKIDGLLGIDFLL